MPEAGSAPEVPELVRRLLDEGPISISAAAALCGTFRQGKRTHASTVTRWALKGFKLPDGRTVRLETYRLAGRLMTSKPALLRFIAAQNEAPSDPPTAPPNPTPKQRRHAAEDASKRMKAILGT
jgi:hypothetical protein